MCDNFRKLVKCKTKCSESSPLSAKLSNRNPIWDGLGCVLDHNYYRPAPNRLSHDVAFNGMGCLWQKVWSNMDLQAHSPTNEVDQCLKWSAKIFVPC